MALKPRCEGKKNRILRSFAMVFLMQDIEQLNKYAYDFINVASGFIAHYNLHGFRAHYGSSEALAEDILFNERNKNTNYSPNEKDYPYYKQKADMYAQICEYARGNFDNIPGEEETFKPPVITDFFEEEPEWRKSIEEAYRNHLAYGNYFNASDPQRVVDLADATMAYNNAVIQSFGEDKVSDTEFLHKEIEFKSGNKGNIADMLNCYRNEIWEIFNQLSDRNFELGIFPEEEEEEDY